MLALLHKLGKDEDGPTAVEYAIMLGAVTAVIVAVVWIFGGTVKNLFEDYTKKM
ncbi:MAG: Flp family type IVb pilin [Deltaproteobacteria bacterium]|nr:Flp family type IVb pilin [Deltaproteobacteria bacterium]